ncbi:glutamate ABC transporter substrate-binding protein [Terracoccus luteus]|uniref:Amino acid ABC transporter substrate-binding protein (PAAT family) n=1 Tax=Terracoccus luteus TaxID=53356 RepID=A0A495Y0C4_9MICO|nr:glutamate ABC transporter substrate-binding protein [Terracoccus luteus]MBB2986286.1 polar amino acid transport system substrate-binding protein [Terracoccus luteus]MCP2172124.1 polar amino acid transport system substrate-binding protein [Terracoccus luteus]RKT79039.1 amino acid ABC transporter substrate-binding protein (PAAT family) [Terracoccus luteus]
MTRRPRAVRRARAGLVTAGAALTTAALAACSSGGYTPTAVPTPRPTATQAQGNSPAASCSTATQSYDPLPSLPAADSIRDAGLRKILDAGRIRVGVSADTYLFGSTNPKTGAIEGFDIDLARYVAERLFGDPGKVQLVVISAADRLPLLQSGRIDMVARNFSMTCDRWDDIAFSAEYYRSGQTLLVSSDLKDAENATFATVKGLRVCAPTGTSSLALLRQQAERYDLKPVDAPNHTGCLVRFQQGEADAITGDDTVLAGLAAQDPYTVVSKAKLVTTEPYGLGVNKDDVYLARYLNRAIAEYESSGRWKKSYDTWLADTLGQAPAPPTPRYGRS